jgi:hypothetical protein
MTHKLCGTIKRLSASCWKHIRRLFIREPTVWSAVLHMFRWLREKRLQLKASWARAGLVHQDKPMTVEEAILLHDIKQPVIQTPSQHDN